MTSPYVPDRALDHRGINHLIDRGIKRLTKLSKSPD
jgi:hypothetical protein